APINAAMTAAQTRRYCPLDPPGRSLLDRAFEALGLSARALDRILKVARTIADLDGGGPIRPAHLAEAIQYRTLDRRGGS
ncbi:MAG: YifB family Mg chelatase-like AAA ATPase, partial [Thermoanaerobaculia bacterium]